MKSTNYWMRQRIRKLSEPRYLLTLGILYTVFITIAFFLPNEQDSGWEIPHFDKAMHICIYALLSFIWIWYQASTDQYHISTKKVFVVLILCLLYGVLIEASQHWFTASRLFDAYDIVANVIGSLIGFLGIRLFKRQMIV